MFELLRVHPDEVAQMQAALEAGARAKGVAPLSLAAESLTRRVDADPLNFLSFGPYWWAAKAAIRPYTDFGPADDPVLRRAYTMDAQDGDEARLKTVVAAFVFAEFYRQNYMRGTREFELNDPQEDGDPGGYCLIDPDMEDRIDV